MAGLYIHIPFCKQTCYYCDFHFSTNRNYQNEMISAMINEMELQKEYLKGESLDTIYFGGGTPSILKLSELDLLLSKAYQLYKVNPNPEITLESNPDDLSNEKLEGLKSLGVNRLSIGIQSFNDRILNFLNRAHTGSEAITCVENARNVGFKNISIDLIFSIPVAKDEDFKADIKTGLLLNPEHISAYSLTIEDKTVFGSWHSKGKLQSVSDIFSAEQFEYLISELEGSNYQHYEVSNFCRNGYYSRHNTSYWKGVSYLGIGPGAHSYNKESRQFNVAHNPRYLKSLSSRKVPFEKEILDQIDKTNEFLLTSIRTVWGCDLGVLDSKYNYQLLTKRKKEIEMFLLGDLIKIENNILFLTKKGILVADEIIGQLFLD